MSSGTTRFDSLAQAARFFEVTPTTVRRWITEGSLACTPPWRAVDLQKAADAQTPYLTRRGVRSEHGSLSRFRAGCRCRKCRDTKNAEDRKVLRAKRMKEWEALGPALIGQVEAGVSLQDALVECDITAQALTEHRLRDPKFKAMLDLVLLDMRDSGVPHGTSRGWKTGCRCPECREYRRKTRT